MSPAEQINLSGEKLVRLELILSMGQFWFLSRLNSQWATSSSPSLFSSTQGDQMSLWKTRPEFSPTHFFKKNIFVANSYISPFNTQTMQSFYTQQHCYVSRKTLYPGRIRTRVFSFLRRMWCPLRHAAQTISCQNQYATFTMKSSPKILATS
jgi:hypothetical protein